MNTFRPTGPQGAWPRRLNVFICALTLFAAGLTARANQPIPTDSPLGFFTNVAARLLSTEMNLDLDHIQIYPTNQYTPAVHRLLQVTANIYATTTGDYFPTVFRPLFTVDGSGNVFITGYTNVSSVSDPGDPQLAVPYDASALAAYIGTASNLPVNVYGVPWIIGAKKGFPNFNEFVQENIVGVTRRLLLTRDTNAEIIAKNNGQPYKIFLTGTNQMYLFSINSSIGLDFWNSYFSNFTDNVTVVYRGVTWMTITNDQAGGVVPILGVGQPLPLPYAGTNTCSGWPGTLPMAGGLPNASSFVTPLYYQFVPVMTPSVYRSGDGTAVVTVPCFVPTNNFVAGAALFETNTPGFPLPHFGLLTTNRLQAFILDFTNNSYHVIDYVHFQQNTGRSLNEEIFTDELSGNWNTNIYTPTGVPYGIANQINISKGLQGVSAEDGTWQGDPEALMYGFVPTVQQASFKAFFQPYGTLAFVGSTSASNYLSSVVAPYSPTRYTIGYTVLQANDPLVHYLTSDLTPSSMVTNFLAPNMPPSYNNNLATNLVSLVGLNLGSLNYNYQPWGGNPVWAYVDQNKFNLAERDPLVTSSDCWLFPTGQSFYVNSLIQTHLNVGWLGQVHRGTPWQTIYLKSSNLLLNTWMTWTGDPDLMDAATMAPIQDWHLASLLTSMFNTNDFRTLFSVNNTDPNAWRSLLDGLTATTNLASGQFQLWTIQSNSPQASVIAGAVESARVGQPGQWFKDAGDILGVPQLAEQSPYFNLAATSNINDAVYEGIASQLLPLIRADSIGSVIPDDGQRILQFTGYDGHDYVIQSSANLIDWINLLTNSPTGGVLNLTNPPSSNPSVQYYRSILLN